MSSRHSWTTLQRFSVVIQRLVIKYIIHPIIVHAWLINQYCVSLSSSLFPFFSYVYECYRRTVLLQLHCTCICHNSAFHNLLSISVRYNTTVHQRGWLGEVLRLGETAFSRLLLYSLYLDTKCTIQTVAVVVTRHLMVGAICDEHKKQQRPVIIHFIHTVNGDTYISR